MDGTQRSGLYEPRLEDLKGELMRLLTANRPLFAKTEYTQSVAAVFKMKPHQYDNFKSRIQETITFRQKHKVHNAGTGQLF